MYYPDEFVETYCGFPVYPVQTIGTFSVYERKGYRSLGVPKYVVFRNDRALEEFRHKIKALSWARRTSRLEERMQVNQKKRHLLPGGRELCVRIGSDHGGSGSHPGQRRRLGSVMSDPALNWVVRVYDADDNELDRWTIKDRTGDEARKEAESEVETRHPMPSTGRWCPKVTSH